MRLLLTFVAVVTIPGCFGLPRLSEAELQSLVVLGSRFVESNCGDCYDATEEDLRLGIALVDSAMRSGFADTILATTVLEAGYRTMAFVYATPESPEQREWLDRLHAALRTLAVLQPDDADAQYDYASTIADPLRQIEALRGVLSLASDHFYAHQRIGFRFLDVNEPDSAALHLLTAAEVADAVQLTNYGSQIVEGLRRSGRGADAFTVGRAPE